MSAPATLSHWTAGTGRVLESPRREVRDGVIAALAPMVARPVPAGYVPGFPGWRWQGWRCGPVLGVHVGPGGGAAPLLTFAVAAEDGADARTAWADTCRTAATGCPLDPEDPPPAPWLLAAIRSGAAEPGGVAAMAWLTGLFALHGLGVDRDGGEVSTAPAYRGVAVDGLVSVTRPDGSPLDPAPSIALHSHSPTGFAWGYGGSGPAQLALALLLDRTGEPDTALRLYQRLKRDMVAAWPWPGGWILEAARLDAWTKAAR